MYVYITNTYLRACFTANKLYCFLNLTDHFMPKKTPLNNFRKNNVNHLDGFERTLLCNLYSYFVFRNHHENTERENQYIS